RLLGLQSSYVNDGDVLLEPLQPWALPDSLQNHRGTIMRLANAYKQLNAPFGKFAMDTLTASTAAIQTGSSTSDTTYATFDTALSHLRGRRDMLAATIRDAVSWTQQAVRKGPVVREQTRPGHVSVEAADRNDTRLGRDELDDRGSPLRVARGGDDARRLVEEQMRELLLPDLAAVDLDAVG